MLSADVRVIELARLRHRVLQYLFRPRRVRQLAQCDRRLALTYGLLDPLVDLLEIHVQIHQYGCGNTLALADQTEENMFRPDIVMLETDRFLACHRQYLTDPVGEVV